MILEPITAAELAREKLAAAGRWDDVRAHDRAVEQAAADARRDRRRLWWAVAAGVVTTAALVALGNLDAVHEHRPPAAEIGRGE